MRVSRFHLRLEKQIQEKLSLILLKQELQDPLLSSITVHRVSLKPNLQSAIVEVSFYLPDVPQEEAIKRLNKVAGFFRSRLGETLSLKMIPVLKFTLAPDSARLEALFEQIHDKNA